MRKVILPLLPPTYSQLSFKMYNARGLPLELILEIIKCLPVNELFNLGLLNKNLHAFTHPIALRKVLSSRDRFLPFLWAKNRANASILIALYKFAESERETVYIKSWHTVDLKEKINRTARDLIFTARDLLFSVTEDGFEPDFSTIDTLLDCPYLFRPNPNSPEFIRRFLCDIYNPFPKKARSKLLFSTTKYLVSRGCKFPRDTLYLIRNEENADETCDWLVRNGFDVDDACEDTNYMTPLSQACVEANTTTIERFLRLGANPNGVGRLAGQPKITYTCGRKNHGRSNVLTRPLDILLDNHKKTLWRLNWQDSASIMYRNIKILIEHGASTSRARFSGDPVRILLDNIWRLLCPVAWSSICFDSSDDVTVQDLLNALLKQDIRPLDKLCDVVIDANPEYSRRSRGLRGKERLIMLLAQRRNLPVKFNFKRHETWLFRDYRRRTTYDGNEDVWHVENSIYSKRGMFLDFGLDPFERL